MVYLLELSKHLTLFFLNHLFYAYDSDGTAYVVQVQEHQILMTDNRE